MSGETDLKELEQRVQKAKALVHLSEIRVEELMASVGEIEKVKPTIRLGGKRHFCRDCAALQRFSTGD